MKFRHLLFGALCAVLGYYYALHGLQLFSLPLTASQLFSLGVFVLLIAFLLPLCFALGMLFLMAVFMLFGRLNMFIRFTNNWRKFN